jgi:hypothetical protein
MGGRGMGGGHPTAGPVRGTGFGVRPGGVGFRPFGGVRFHNGFRRSFVWPWWGWGWGGWGWGWDGGWGSDSYDYQQQQQSSYNQQLSLQGQVQYLQQQLAELRHDQEVQRDYAQSQSAPAPGSAAAPAASKPQDLGPPTTLVFRDGKRIETHNYAIADRTLWLMADNGRLQKVPLSELDREATLKSNEDRGVQFPLPKQQ